jgi:ABC-2 type transport system permease protein
MKLNTANILTVAQKEFADNLYSSRFRAMLGLVMLMLLSYSIMTVKMAAEAGYNSMGIDFYSLLDVIFGVSYAMIFYFPILGIALGYDAIAKEKVSNSLNTLLTHPVFRDSIIFGKAAGGLITLVLVIFLSILCSVGVILVYRGTPINMIEVNQILIFTFISFMYLSVFFALGMLFSTIFDDPAKSFMLCIMVWVVFVLVFGSLTSFVASMATGEAMYSEDGEHALKLYSKLQYLSPVNHYSQMVIGYGLSEGDAIQRTSAGLFDPGHTLGDWFRDYWTNLVGLTVTPVLLIIVSILFFMKKDVVR